MSQSLLLSTVVILIEILLAVLALYYLGFRHYLRLKARLREKPVIEKQVDNNLSDDVKLTEYLQAEIEHTTQRLDQVEQLQEQDVPVAPLKRRLELLLAERQVYEIAFKPENKNNRWNIINTYYEDNTSPVDTVSEPESGDDSQIKELTDKVQELEKFEGLFTESEKKLQEAKNTIESLNASLEETSQSDGNDAEEINKLKQEIDRLQNLLESANQSVTSAKVEDDKLEGELEEKQEALKAYERMVSQTNDKLDASSKIIDDLKNIISNSDSSSEQKQMQHMITKLTDDNLELKKKMDLLERPNTNLMQAKKAAEKQALQEELVMYMDLFIQANEKLKESNSTIEEFKKILESSESSEELNQIQDMVEKLIEDNNELQAQLATQKEPAQGEDNAEQQDVSQVSDSHDEELDIYKSLVQQANEKLKESNTTIEELKKLLDASAPSEELEQMKKMIDKLSQDNVSLLNQISSLKEESKETIETVKNESETQKEMLHDEISMYKDLVCQANDKLKESNQTIEELKAVVSKSVPSDETEQMEAMLDKLSEDNIQLGKQLETVSTQLQESLNNVELLKQQDTDLMKELEIVKEEKWFLEQQIKHLQTKVEEHN